MTPTMTPMNQSTVSLHEKRFYTPDESRPKDYSEDYSTVDIKVEGVRRGYFKVKVKLHDEPIDA